MPIRDEPSVVIVGGGLSGSLVAAELLRRARAPLRLTIVERAEAIGPGTAYRTACPEHFLNVRARGMSAVAGDADHFVRWLAEEGKARAEAWGASADPERFSPRGLYGEYVSGLLAAAERAAAPGVLLERRRAEVAAVEDGADGARILTRDGEPIVADFIVLALGNAPPGDPDGVPAEARDRPWYAPDPWSGAALQGFEPTDDLLILGTNLTMIDLAVALARSGHSGTIHAVSRRGLLPRVHGAAGAPVGPAHPLSAKAGSWAAEGAPALTALVRELRASIRSAVGEGHDWRMGFDALRPHTQAIWRSMPERERRRFLRHLRPYWEVHRHRAVPANMEDIGRMIAAGRLRPRAGALAEIVEVGRTVRAQIRIRGAKRIETTEVARIINATGPAPGHRRARDPLVERMVKDRLVREGPLGFGLDALPDGTLVGADGVPARRLATLGPPLRGVLWETTAVPEIREQAASLAERILERLAGRPGT